MATIPYRPINGTFRSRMTHSEQNPFHDPNKLRARVVQAAEDALERSGSVGPLDVLMELQWLYGGHVEEWQRGNQYFANLEAHFQSTPEKRSRVYQYFLEWVKE